MNIGILTHCIANNFGANLQALSTASYLRNHGYTPIFINWSRYLAKRNLNMDSKQLEIHRGFLERQGFELTDECEYDNDFVREIKKHNIHNILVGSDAVLTVCSWFDRLRISRHGVGLSNVSLDKTFPNPFWLPFRNKLEGCNYFLLSPSCQSTSYKFLNRKTLKMMEETFKCFKILSARDTYTANMVSDISGKPCPITPDPVWGINDNVKCFPTKEDIIKKFGLEDDYILISFYGGRSQYSVQWMDKFRRIANDNGMEAYACPMPQGPFQSNLPQINLPINPLDWFALIKHSKGYVGNNMHPVIVSILNVVPFFSIDHHGKNFLRWHFENTSKVLDLLSLNGLSEYRVSAYTQDKVSPDYVFDKLANFDYANCTAVSRNMTSKYFHFMSEITANFCQQ